MATHKIYSGSSWVTGVNKVWTGSAWSEQLKFWDGSAWIDLFVSGIPSILLLPTTLTAIEEDFGEVWARIQLTRAGQVGRDSTYSSLFYYSDYYILGGDRTSTIGDQYEFKLVKTSGNQSTATISGLTDNVWYTINTTRYFTVNAEEEGYSTYYATLYIRNKATPADQVQTNLQLIADGDA